MTGQTSIFIKNMVCDRCIKVVREELEKLGLEVLSIQLGEVKVKGNHFPADKLKEVLEANGFELLEDKKVQTINRVKSLIVELVHSDKLEHLQEKLSTYLSRETGQDYQYLSNLFSTAEGITIEHFTILQKIERAKELIRYNELTLSEIAYRLGYSSVQHLSSQFKKVTGFSASQFKEITDNYRKPIDKLI